MKSHYLLLTLTLALLLPNSEAVAKSQPAEVSIEGLNLIDKDRRGEIYAEAGVDWNEYTQIKLERATVSFRKNWQRDQNRYDPFKVRDQDVEKIKTRLSDLFNEVFTEELSAEGGYTMTESIGADVMTFVPRIVDLDIAAPDTRNNPGMTTSYVEQAGRMTLILEIYDSQSGDLISKMSHRQDAPRYGYMRWANSVSNTAEARRMLQRWAGMLIKRLNEAKSKSASTQ
jgi:hypothetical protein